MNYDLSTFVSSEIGHGEVSKKHKNKHCECPKDCQQKSEDRSSFTIDSLDVGLNTFK